MSLIRGGHLTAVKGIVCRWEFSGTKVHRYIHLVRAGNLSNLPFRHHTGLILNSHTKITGFQMLVLITRLILIAPDAYSGTLL